MNDIPGGCCPIPGQLIAGLENVLRQFSDFWQVFENMRILHKLCRPISQDFEIIEKCSVGVGVQPRLL